MIFRKSVFTLLATFAFALSGCNGGVEDQPELDTDIERTSPEADVEVTPGGEAEVDVDPEIRTEEGLGETNADTALGNETETEEDPETVTEVGEEP